MDIDDELEKKEELIEDIENELNNNIKNNNINNNNSNNINNNSENKEITTYGGVLEFTSKEGEVFLPQKIITNLNLNNNNNNNNNNEKEEILLLFELVSLPTANFVQFQPVYSSANFSSIKNPKARLESSLRSSVCFF